MNLREALETLSAAERKGLNRDLVEYFLSARLDYVLLSFDEVDQLEALGVYCWYVSGEPGVEEPVMHYYSIGGSK